MKGLTGVIALLSTTALMALAAGAASDPVGPRAEVSGPVVPAAAQAEAATSVYTAALEALYSNFGAHTVTEICRSAGRSDSGSNNGSREAVRSFIIANNLYSTDISACSYGFMLARHQAAETWTVADIVAAAKAEAAALSKQSAQAAYEPFPWPIAVRNAALAADFLQAYDPASQSLAAANICKLPRVRRR